ncbi:MAG: V-type ATP synthase subunit F [Desulfobacteraceae bacterium]|jgi:vacuolar-type H+-ATPase subunit F/Vma7|nr:V-type ATP synthase subunit F [Desulfobacteraceae bacterium]
MKIFVLADPDTCLTFSLAGIRTQTVYSGAEVLAILESLDRQETGLVLITERLAEKNRDVIDRILLEEDGPLILEIPDIKGPLSEKPKATQRILSLVRR